MIRHRCRKNRECFKEILRRMRCQDCCKSDVHKPGRRNDAVVPLRAAAVRRPLIKDNRILQRTRCRKNAAEKQRHWRLQCNVLSNEPSLRQEAAVRIGNFDEEKRVGRHGLSGIAAVAAFNDAAKVLQRNAAAPHFEEGAYNGAHHVAQEAVGLDFKAPAVGLRLGPCSTEDVADIRFCIGAYFTETCEVRVFRQELGGLVHQLEIGRLEKA